MAVPGRARTARLSARPAADEHGTIELVLSGGITPEDVPRLCARAARLLEGRDEERIVCNVAAVTNADVATVDALSRLQLLAHRLGRRIRVARASGDLRRLIDLMGLSEVLRPCAEAGSGLESRRETE